MPTVEATGKSLEEARQRAAAQLGCDEADLTVEIIEEPRRLLGIIGGSEYRIRATFGESEETAMHADEADHIDEIDEAEEPVETDDDHAEDAAPDEDSEQSIPDLVAGRAFEALEQIASLMGLDAEVSMGDVSEEEVAVEITGPDAGRLIGRHGATLDALQLLVAVMANRGLTQGARVIVDIEGYRAKREEMLREMARTHAEQAKEAAKEIVIRDLKPYERRIIHMELVDDPDVETYSEGDDDDRQLVISPRG